MSFRSDEERNDLRLVHDPWRTTAPLAAVIVALFVLVALPVVRTLQVNPLYEEMRTVSEPSRSLLTRIHAALALEQSLLRDYVEGHDSLAVRRYARAVADEHKAYAELAPLLTRLGPEFQITYDQLRDVEAAWHSAVEKIIRRPNPQTFNRDPVHAKLYEEVLLAAAHLDEQLTAAAASRRAVIEATNRAQVWITFAIGILALAAGLIVASLGKRLRAFAASEEQARRELEEATESRERLIRGITHDLKNPLQAIMGYADLLDEAVMGPLTDAQHRFVRSIRSSASHLLTMIADLLELSKAEVGKLQIRPVEISLADIARETVSEYETRAKAARLSLSVVTTGVPRITTDPQRVRQILQNLLSNAVKYTPAEGRVTVSVEARAHPGSTGISSWVAVDVADTGNGIPPEHVENIFDEFSRLDHHMKLPGTGLGLAIAKRISMLLGGDITVATSATGSTFTLWLPQDRRTSSNKPANKRLPTASTVAPQSR